MNEELTPEQQAELDARLLAQAEEEAARLAELARLEALQTQIDELGDIALIVAEYIKDAVVTEDDSINLAGFEAKHIESNFGWNIASKAKPTLEVLQSFKDIAAVKQLQSQVNEEALKLLADTDWQITRELETGTPCSPEVKQARAEARAKIVR